MKGRLNEQSPAVQYLVAKDSRLGAVVKAIGTIDYELDSDIYRFLVFTIIGQMLSNKVADVLCDRFVNLCHGQVSPEAVHELQYDTIRSIGISKAKTEYIQELTNRFIATPEYFADFDSLSDNEVFDRITAVRGLGAWSAKMVLIFVLGREDVLPVEDGAFVQAAEWLLEETDNTRAKKHLAQMCAHWHPYSSIAARYLYQALDKGLTKTPIKDL